MKRQHNTPTPGAIGCETQNDKSNSNSEVRAGEEKVDHELPEEVVLSEDSSEEAVIYDLWGTNNEEESNLVSNTSKKLSSVEKEEDCINSDSELSWEDDSDDDNDSFDRYSDQPKNETAESWRENVSSVMERLDYMITKEGDPLMKETMLKYKYILKGKPNTAEHELGSVEGHGQGSAEDHGQGSAEDHGVNHKEIEEDEINPILESECTADEYSDSRGRLLRIEPLPHKFFSLPTSHPLHVWDLDELKDVEVDLSWKKTDTEMKECKKTDKEMKIKRKRKLKKPDNEMQKRMVTRSQLKLKNLESQLNNSYDENGRELTFNKSVSERMSCIMGTVKDLVDKEELYLEDKEEIDVLKEMFEEHSEVKEEECQLSRVIAETVATAGEEEKKCNAAEIASLESHKFVKALPCTILSLPKDSDDSDVSTEDEYKDGDTSDEEDIRNTVGNIPMRWYDDYDHLGYDWEGHKIVKPPAGDELDNFLRKMEDPNFWRTVKDPQTGQDVVLCNEDVEVLKRLTNSKIPDATHEEYGPWIEWFSSEVMQTPVCDFPESKKSFIPSRHEAKKVSKIVYAIKRGWIKPKKKKPKRKAVYMLWETDNAAEPMRRIHNHISAPKRSLPNHAESYNPPQEYLFDAKEEKEWRKLKPSQRKLPFFPRKYRSLRDVPAYEQYVEERFRRCLDLYLCPRTRKMKLLIEPDDLLPKLPSPRDLQPFPTTQSLVYRGHTEMVRTISVEPKGQYLASGSDDFTVKLWEVATGRCVRTIPVGGIVRSVSWCPNEALALLAVAANSNLFLINPCVGDILVVKKTDLLLQEEPEQDVLVSDRLKNAIQWEQATGDDWKKGIRVIIHHFKEIKQVTWHGRGDYFASVMPDAQNRSVIIHQVSKRRSQIPFSRSKGLVQCVLFHPIRPVFFVATQKFVRIYDLVKQIVLKKLFSNAKWISTMAIHPAGDNLLVGTYDRKVLWFDLDLSTKPYQTLRLHSGGVRGVAYHRNYPLFATSSDDNNIVVSHGMVYNDLLQNALIVPLKRLSFHEKINDFSVFDIVFHPTQPWLFSTGADSTVRLYT